MTLKFSTRETERLQTKTLLKICLLFIFLIAINPVRIKNLFFSGVIDENIKKWHRFAEILDNIDQQQKHKQNLHYLELPIYV